MGLFFRNDIGQRNVALVVMRFIAALCITQSHVACLLPSGWQFAVVGADVGDGLFFFCAGFALFLSRSAGGFCQWYARKVVRILPPFLMMGLLTGLFFGVKFSFIEVVSCKGYWFVQAIMIYYAILYFIKRCCLDHLQLSFGLGCLLLVVYGLFSLPFGPHYQIWGEFRFFSVYFLPVMLMGAMVGRRDSQIPGNMWPICLSTLVVFVALMIHFGVKVAIARGIIVRWTEIQLLTMFALSLAIFAFYNLLTHEAVKKMLLRGRSIYAVVYFVASLTLEIYIVNSFVIKRTPYDFPINLALTYLLIVAAAFVLKASTNLVIMFLRGNVCWREVLFVD